MKLTKALVALTLISTQASAQINAGAQAPEASLPFTMTQVTSFNLPWRIAFLPDGRRLITEKVGPLWLVTQKGEKTPVTGVPAVLYGGQGGMLGVYLSPHYATDHFIYLTYSEPHESLEGRAPCATDAAKMCGSSLAMARAKLVIGNAAASLDGLQVLWHDPAGGNGGQFGAAIAFAPDGNSLFLSSGERQRMTPAQNPDSPLGKILHLTLDGKPAPGNPNAGKASAQSLPIIVPPADTEKAKTAEVVRTFAYSAAAPNRTQAETWSIGHRTPYGLAFAPNGQLWELEHGPKGGDKLNLIAPGKNYGWPLASYATNYNGVPIPTFDNQPNLAKPVIYWTPVIAPGNLTFYKGSMFKGWAGSALATGMASKSMTRIVFDGKGGAKPAERWDMGIQVRDIAVAPDGALWAIDNANPGGLYRLTPK